MTKKREYLAKNIREGVKIETAREKYHLTWSIFHKAVIRVESFNNGRDVYGNGTAHYNCYLEIYNGDKDTIKEFWIVSSGTRREQVGYSGKNEAALYALRKLGYELDTSKVSNYAYKETDYYPVLNFKID